MTNQALLSRLQAFEIDAPGAAMPFSRKLAAEQNWPQRYAARVIQEYRRFLFLAAMSDSIMSPSPAVDAAWHLHLTYTRSYWGGLCGEVLGRELHHEPSSGGRAESQRYQQYYRGTLARYTAEFGEAPPADIWPAPCPVGAAHKRPAKRPLAPALAAAGSLLVTPAFAASAAASSGGWAVVLIAALPILLILGLLARASGGDPGRDKRKNGGCGGAVGGGNGSSCDGGGDGGGCDGGGGGCGGGCGGS